MKGFIIELTYYDENGVEHSTVRGSPARSSLFMSLFKDILNDIGQLYWVAPEQWPFASSYARDGSEMEFYYEELAEEYNKNLEFDLVSPPYSIFPKYARWIRDDNNTFVGFYHRPDERLVKRLMEISNLQDYFDIVDMFCNNEDASFWEYFTKDSQLIDRALKSALKVVDRKHILLMDSDEREEFYNVTWS